MAAPPDREVSSDDEQLILVDANDRDLGFASKRVCHDGEGKLHRAFSVFLFDPDLRLLLQQRAAGKRLWPGIWANTCCSHPRRGEAVPAAARRRVEEELNLRAAPSFLFKFEYHARYEDLGSEHELCWVLAGAAPGEPRVNRTEIAAWRFVAPDELDAALREDPDRYSPWLHLEWPRLRAEHWGEVERLVRAG